MATMKKPAKKMQMMGGTTKAKKGGSFDLNKDGKTTFKDVLIGRGVLPKNTAKKGMKVKKKMNYGGEAASMKPTMKSGGKMKRAMMGAMAEPMMKKGGKMTKTCKYGCK
jgi:hypothetical protein